MAAGMATAGGPNAEAASLRGELCCVDTEPGLRPFTGHGSPGGKGARRQLEPKQQLSYLKHKLSKLSFFFKRAAFLQVFVKCEKTKPKRTKKNKVCPYQAFALSFSQSS